MNIKLIALLAIATSAVGAQALSFDFQSVGTSSVAGSTLSATDTALSASSPMPDPLGAYTFVSLAYSFSAAFSPSVPTVGMATGGTGTLTVHDVAANADLSFDFTFSGVASRVGSGLNNVGFSSGAFTATGPDGSISGSISGTLKNGLSNTTFIGEITPVPEPASMAALAVGGMGLLARRRRKA